MKKTEEQVFIIDEEKVNLTFTQFSPREGLKVGVRFAKLMGGPLGKIFSGITKTGDSGDSLDDLDFDFQSIGPAIEALFDRLDEDQVLDTVDMLLKPVIKGNKSLNLDDPIFQGNPFKALAIAKKSAEVNFSDFFAGASGVLGRLKEVGQQYMTTKTSTGGSGDQS